MTDDIAILVCMPNGPSEFTDNWVAPCSRCGQEVMYRPHAPMGIAKVCMACFTEDHLPEPERLMVTKMTALEVARMRRKRAH